ncbi:MAG: thiamine pyrophosphate-binding protein [Myxococcales bacterium]|nr:thiamine pyrophosphate-binding protein [Myxococcales bacterium]
MGRRQRESSGARMVDITLRYLRAEGARVVFGVPGGLLHPFFQAVVEEPELRLVVTKHEAGAAFMADGYARASSSLAVCAGTSGPGATNLLTGVACAFCDGVPMLVITGQAPSHAIGRGAAQEMAPEDIDIVAMFKPITKYSAMVPAPNRVSHHLRRALRLALTGQQGPVHLNVPVDFWEQPARPEWFAPQTYRPSTEVLDRQAVQDATRWLMRAEYPALLVGSGVASSNARVEVQQLAEIFQARVATTPRAKGVFPEDHPLSLGVMGIAGHATARDTLLSDRIDVLLTIGASLNETTTLNWHPRLMPRDALIQLDISIDTLGRNYPVTVPLVGDARTVLSELIFQIERELDNTEAATRWGEESPVTHEHAFYEHPELRLANTVPITPQRWRVELSAILPGNAIVFSDIGGHMLFNIHDLVIRKRQSFILNLGFGSMGHGTAGPIGAALAAPHRPVISIIGDACFTMSGMELLTAAEYDVPVIWLVENNQMHGITWHGSQQVGSGKPTDAIRYRRHLDIAGIARAMGVQAWVVERPGELRRCFMEALERRRPGLIEILVDGAIQPPLGERAKTIAGFRDR